METRNLETKRTMTTNSKCSSLTIVKESNETESVHIRTGIQRYRSARAAAIKMSRLVDETKLVG